MPIIRRLAVVLAMSLFTAQAASAASLVVNRSDDPSGSASCAANTSCSLRQAITDANTAGGTNNITFSGVSTVTLDHTLGNAQGQLKLNNTSLTIDGGSGVTIATDGAANGNNMLVLGNNTASPLAYTLQHLTLDGTNISTNNGGAVVSVSTGGGAATTTATLDHLTVENGTDQSGGGGLQSTGATTIIDSTIQNNHLTTGTGAGIDVADGSMTIIRSTISGNTAPNDFGGGVNIHGGSTVSAVSIVNSTITGNSAKSGAGIEDGTGLLKLSYSTVSNNTTSDGTSGALDFTGIHTDSLKADIINDAGTSTNECSTTGTITGGFNFIRDTTCGSSTANSNHPGTPISLGALGNNSGPTQTQALAAGSPAIDAAQSSSCTDLNGGAVSVDQRGVVRPQGSACDAGAFEFVRAPANSVRPSISGAAAVGQTLTCNAGTWSGSPTFAYLWRSDGNAITGATTSTYNVASADAGHTLTCHVTATNSGGSNSADSAGLAIPAASGGGGPAISAYTLSPSAFRAASSGGSIARRRPPIGTTVRYTLSEAAKTSFTVVRLVPGRKHGRKCRAASHRNRKGKKCTRLITIGSFSRQSTAGANSFKFTGRINGHKLRVGNYKLLLKATDAGGRQSTKFNRPFRIVK